MMLEILKIIGTIQKIIIVSIDYLMIEIIILGILFIKI